MKRLFHNRRLTMSMRRRFVVGTIDGKMLNKAGFDLGELLIWCAFFAASQISVKSPVQRGGTLNVGHVRHRHNFRRLARN